MPEKLERCVRAVIRERGVDESTAYAICTASLKRAKKRRVSAGLALPDGKVHDAVRDHVELAFGLMSDHDVRHFRPTREIGITDFGGVMAVALLKKNRIYLNPNTFERVGHDSDWYASTLIHELMHSRYGYGENEATAAAQAYAGCNVFSCGLLDGVYDSIYKGLNIAIAAQAQRVTDLPFRYRKNDFYRLVKIGYTPKAARGIIEHAARLASGVKSSYQKLREGQVNLISPATMTLLVEPDSEEIHKTAQSVLFAEFYGGDSDPDMILKTTDPDTSLIGRRSDADVYESVFRFAVQSGVRISDIIDIVADVRRSGYDVRNLDSSMMEKRSAVLSRLIEESVRQGFFTQDETLTPAHASMILIGFSPLLSRTKELFGVEDENED